MKLKKVEILKYKSYTGIANAESHTHLQFATANAKPKIAKEYVFANASKFAEK